MATPARIRESWNIRQGLIDGILNRGETLIESLELIPETRKSITFERWKEIVAKELEEATTLYGTNGEPLLSEQELVTLASITNPCRGW